MPHTASTGTDSGLHRPLVTTRAACGSVKQQQQQQRRMMSSESNDNPEGTQAIGAAEADELVEPSSTGADAESAAADGGEEAAAAPVDPAPIPLVQVDGIPFDASQQDLEQWFADAGCSPAKVTMPFRPESSNRVGQNKGRAFVEMANEEDTLTALSLTGRTMGERWVNISRLDTRVEEVSFVGGGGGG